MLNEFNSTTFYLFLDTLGRHIGLVCCIIASAIISYIFLTTIQSLLNTGMQSANMRHTEAMARRNRRNRELVIRLAAQKAYNVATGQRHTYLSRNFPAACSLYTREDLQDRFNTIIPESNDVGFHVFNERVSYRSNNTIRSSIVIICIVQNSLH